MPVPRVGSTSFRGAQLIRDRGGTRAARDVVVRVWFAAAFAYAAFSTPGTARADSCETFAIWRDGHRVDTVCRDDAAGRGLTVIDLDEDWVPPILAPAPDGTGPSYRATYLALAQERFAAAGSDRRLAERDRYLELYGIEPTFAVVRERLADDVRHHCHDEIDNTALEALSVRVAEESKTDALARIARAKTLRAGLEGDRRRAELPDLDALAARAPYFRHQVDRLAASETYVAAVRAAQAHLACDRLYQFPPIDGAYTWQTSNAIETFQRGVMILPTGVLDGPTRDALVLDSRERDFRTALRVLRARLIAATGLIEDGTAGTGQARVLDRELEPEGTWRVRGHEPLDRAAPDLIAAATEVAARALGWHDASSTLAFFIETRTREVAVQLPPPPTYHAAAMTLSAEIDRGDVWHDPTPRWHDALRRPALILYATEGERRIPLARWPTTIGGWQNEKVASGHVVKEWKESPVGHRLWRDMYVGPTWLPPETTPDRELVRPTDGRYVLAREVFGPSYRAAFGLVAFPHLAEERERGKTVLEYRGVRTHGTSNLTSIAHGVSHGCHRLLGMHALRLADFALAHEPHVRRGDERTYYRRVVRYRGHFPVAIDSLGYRIELVSPIPVDVLPGRIHRR